MTSIHPYAACAFVDRLTLELLCTCVQCDVGHMLYSPCRDKLKDAAKCHVCGVAMAGGYRRCHGMERL